MIDISSPAIGIKADIALARQHIELLTGSPDTAVWFRFIRTTDRDAPVFKQLGTVDNTWPLIERHQSDGYCIFIVVNEGGNEPADIEKVRALFIDGDYLPRPDTWEWHVEPDFITHRGPHNWHAYWLVDDLPPEKFENAQRRLIEHYRSDKAVHDLPRVMRLAGTLHLKDPLHTRRASLFETAKSNSLVPLGKVFFEKLWRPEAQFRFARDSPLEREGFEPSVPRKPDNGFADCPVQPLRLLHFRERDRVIP